MNWWTLQGPRNFIESVMDDIRQGKSVFLYLPQNCPARLTGYLRESAESFPWEEKSVELGKPPLDFLYEHFASETPSRTLRSITRLVSAAGFSGRIILLQDIADSDWPAWSGFFEEYERISRTVADYRRTSFIVLAEGIATARPVPKGVGLSTRRWDGWLGRNDMLLYSTSCVRDRESNLETDLATALIAAIGGWDPELCELLAEKELRELISPHKLLKTFAAERGWSFPSASSVPFDDLTWSMGLWQTYLGELKPHTCYAEYLNGSRFIDRLIWRAEIGVLMPYIEEKRQDLIERFRLKFRLPHYTKDGGIIQDVYDLEIGHIEFQLAHSRAIPEQLVNYISHLKDARNSLSHFNPVNTEKLLHLCTNACENRY